MECSQVRASLSAYLDQVLDQQESALIKNHLQDCSGCREEWEALQETMTIINTMDDVEPPADFHNRLLGRLKQVQRPAKVSVWRKYRWVVAAAAMLLLAVGLANSGYLTNLRPQTAQVKSSFPTTKSATQEDKKEAAGNFPVQPESNQRMTYGAADQSASEAPKNTASGRDGQKTAAPSQVVLAPVKERAANPAAKSRPPAAKKKAAPAAKSKAALPAITDSSGEAGSTSNQEAYSAPKPNFPVGSSKQPDTAPAGTFSIAAVPETAAVAPDQTAKAPQAFKSADAGTAAAPPAVQPSLTMTVNDLTAAAAGLQKIAKQESLQLKPADGTDDGGDSSGSRQFTLVVPEAQYNQVVDEISRLGEVISKTTIAPLPGAEQTLQINLTLK